MPVRAVLIFLLIWLLAPMKPVLAAPELLLDEKFLASKGINMRLFSMVSFNYDGTVLVCVERISALDMKQRGFASQLRVFRFHGAQLVRLDTIPLPTTDFQNLALDSAGARALVVGEGGSKFIWVDLASQRTTVFWTHKRGTPGFRSEGVVLWSNGSFHMQGYLHNNADQQTFYGVVRVNPARSGADMFEPTLDLQPVIRHLGGTLSLSMIIDSTEAFFAVTPKPGLVVLYYYLGGGLREIDRMVAIGGAAATHGRIVYSARFLNGSRDVKLRDLVANKTWMLGRNNLPFNYLFASTNGKTVVITLMDFSSNIMSYFYATEAGGFKPQPIPRLQNVKPGTLRLSGNGKAFAFYNPGGLLYGLLP